jgi:hypothetical protein
MRDVRSCSTAGKHAVATTSCIQQDICVAACVVLHVCAPTSLLPEVYARAVLVCASYAHLLLPVLHIRLCLPLLFSCASVLLVLRFLSTLHLLLHTLQ